MYFRNMAELPKDSSSSRSCAQCGTLVVLAPGQSVGRTEVCDSCGADLHACVQCAHYDESSYNECREPQADRVVDKERSNFCEYFSMSSTGRRAKDGTKKEALKKLDDLFK